jgi:Mn2+/Fe2+ NRAMP family transporter
MGAALRLLIGGPVGLYVVLFAAFCTVLEIFSSYRRYVKILKWLTLSLFAYVATAFVIDMPWAKSPTTPSCRTCPGIRTISS